MTTTPRPALLAQRLNIPTENQEQQRRRRQAALQVAQQMIRNGCCSNSVSRYTGLREEEISQLLAA